jgi:hypothetical protein
MTKGIPKKRQRAEQLRKKRTQAASGRLQGAKSPPTKAIHIASASPRPSVGSATAMAEPLSPAHYPIKRSSLGKPQTAGDR